MLRTSILTVAVLFVAACGKTSSSDPVDGLKSVMGNLQTKLNNQKPVITPPKPGDPYYTQWWGLKYIPIRRWSLMYRKRIRSFHLIEDWSISSATTDLPKATLRNQCRENSEILLRRNVGLLTHFRRKNGYSKLWHAIAILQSQPSSKKLKLEIRAFLVSVGALLVLIRPDKNLSCSASSLPSFLAVGNSQVHSQSR